MRVAIFTHSLHKDAFLATFRGIAWGLYENGVRDIEVIVYSGETPSGYPPGTSFKWLPGGRALRAIWPLRRYLKASQPDFLITGPTYVNLAAILMSIGSAWRRRGGKLIISQHAPIDGTHEDSVKNNKYLSKFLYRFAAGFYGVSPPLVDEAIDYCGLAPERCACIPNILVATKQCEIMKEFDDIVRNSEQFVFLSVARLVHQKNLPFLLESFREFLNVADARLVLLGSGPDEPSLLRQVSDLGIGHRVHFLGHVPNPTDYMAKAGALIFTSRFEGFGQVATEAMSVGCPLICENERVGALAYVTGQGKFAKLVPANDRDALVQAMLDVMAPETRRRYSESGLERASAFSPKVVGRELVGFLERIRAQGG